MPDPDKFPFACIPADDYFIELATRYTGKPNTKNKTTASMCFAIMRTTECVNSSRDNE